MILTQIGRNTRFLLLIGALFAHGVHAADTLDQARYELNVGAASLAVQTLQAMPNASDADARAQTEPWLWQALALADKPDEVLKAAAALPDASSDDLRRKAYALAAHAALTLQQPQTARHYLQALIWQLSPDAATLPLLQSMVVQSHLMPGMDEQVFSLWQRYLQDYGHQADLDHAMVVAELAAGKNQGLSSLRQHLANTDRLAWLLDACNDDLSHDVREQALARLLTQPLKPGEWVVLHTAADHAHDERMQVMLLEQAVNGDAPPSGQMVVALWQGWHDLSQGFGNVALLLFGSDKGWAEQADKLTVTDPLMSRAIWAHLVQSANDPALRQRAMLALLDQLHQAGLDKVALAVFEDQWHENNAKELDAGVRWRLGRAAFAVRQFVLADRMWQGLIDLPAQMVAPNWFIRHVQAACVAEDWQAMAPAMTAWLAAVTRPDNNTLWQMSVCIGNGVRAGMPAEQAQPLLQGLLGQAQGALQPEVMRQLAGLASPIQAADWYLQAGRHAISEEDGWQDRLAAADALTKATHLADARRMYQTIESACPIEKLQQLARLRLMAIPADE